MTGDEIRALIREELTASEDRVLRAVDRLIHDSDARQTEFARDVETRLLTSFEKYAKRMDARWTALRLITNDNINSIEELTARFDRRDAETFDWKARAEQIQEEIRAKLAALERSQPPQKP